MSESQLHLRPGIMAGSYPQKKSSDLGELEQMVGRFFGQWQQRLGRKKRSLKYIGRQVKQQQQALQAMSEQELTTAIEKLRDQLYRQGLTQEQLILQAFATIREAASRSLGKSHYDVQLFGGWLMVNGMLAEMETGEGKTLTMTLPACTAALAGIPVHVITANDYLAARDSELMQPLYERLGLTTAAVIDGLETEQRQQAYQADIVHTTNQQVAFDYLRDRIEMGNDTGALRFEWRQHQRQRPGAKPLLLRGLCFALIDEADSVLIDEAKTPLIISQNIPNEETDHTYSDALYLASVLFLDQDFKIDKKLRRIELTLDGENKLKDMIVNLPKLWQQKRKRESLVIQALNAIHFYEKDKHYVVQDDKVLIIDESTGRLMPDRSWEQGLHQMIEAKEGCVISERREPLARISYQRFFSRYLKLGGASGTLHEVKRELHQVYGLDVVKVPTHHKSKRQMLAEKVFHDETTRQKLIIDRIRELYAQQRPVLIGTCSVAESEQVSAWMQQHDIPHQVLNAKQDQHEADIIARAGQPGAITVATNMAGRGTDIALGEGIADKGGLHVLALSRNESRRVDRQLYGRCARQGEPGSAEAMLSLEDPALEQFYSSAMLRLMAKFATGKRAMWSWLSRPLLRLPQHHHEKEQHRSRRLLMKEDKKLQRILAFSGRFE
ncbi:MAG: prepilin peptidase [Gammaproteobacteria bacterium]|nr:prepilin peptidase [Gammaproteobacteria bacterium]